MDKNAELSEIYTTWGFAKLLQHTDVLYQAQNDRYFKPIQVQLCPTELCESDCPFCAVGYRPYKSFMPWEMIEKCIIDFKSLGAKSVEITGGGNPILYRDKKANKDVNDIIRLAASLKLDIGLITNSESLKRVSSELFDSITWIRISLIKLDEGKEPKDYDFCGFPYSKLGFSYIAYDRNKGCRTGDDYEGTSFKTFEKIVKLVELHPDIKFVRVAGDSLFPMYNQQTKEKYSDYLEQYSKFFIKDIGEFDYPFDSGCYVGMIRPYIAASPHNDGKYYVYICNSHVLFSQQTYNTDFALCEVQDVVPKWKEINDFYKENGYPYEVRGNKGKNWQSTCKLCFYHPNNKLLYSVVNEIPDKNFP